MAKAQKALAESLLSHVVLMLHRWSTPSESLCRRVETNVLNRCTVINRMHLHVRVITLYLCCLSVCVVFPEPAIADACNGLPTDCRAAQNQLEIWNDTTDTWSVHCHMVIKGHDIGESSELPLYKPKIHECAQACEQLGNSTLWYRYCRAFTYIFINDTEKGTIANLQRNYSNCFLKTTGRYEDLEPLSQVAPPDPKAAKGGLVALKPLPSCVRVVSVLRSEMRCSKDANNTMPGKCSELKPLVQGYLQNKWRLFCDIDITSHDLGTPEDTRDRTFQECAALCDHTDDCKAFTYVYGRIGTPDKNCFLKFAANFPSFYMKEGGDWSEHTQERRCIQKVSMAKPDNKAFCNGDSACTVAFVVGLVSLCISVMHVLIATPYIARCIAGSRPEKLEKLDAVLSKHVPVVQEFLDRSTIVASRLDAPAGPEQV